MVTNQEEESNVVEPTQPHGNKRKTPKQYRLAPPKLAKNREITAADKKKFKDMFLTTGNVQPGKEFHPYNGR